MDPTDHTRPAGGSCKVLLQLLSPLMPATSRNVLLCSVQLPCNVPTIAAHTLQLQHHFTCSSM